MAIVLKYLSSTTHTRLLKYTKKSIDFVNTEFKKFVSSVKEVKE